LAPIAVTISGVIAVTFFKTERMCVERAIGRNDVDMIAIRAEHAKLGINDENAVDIAGARRASDQFGDLDDVARGNRSRHVGLLRDAFQPPADGVEERFDARAQELGLTVELAAELVLGEQAKLFGLPRQALIEAQQRERGR
jgi:hypothetical protein